MDLVCNIVAIAKNQELDRQNMLTEFTSRSKNLQKVRKSSNLYDQFDKDNN